MSNNPLTSNGKARSNQMEYYGAVVDAPSTESFLLFKTVLRVLILRHNGV
jgi:hypothetical protein